MSHHSAEHENIVFATGSLWRPRNNTFEKHIDTAFHEEQ